MVCSKLPFLRSCNVLSFSVYACLLSSYLTILQGTVFVVRCCSLSQTRIHVGWQSNSNVFSLCLQQLCREKQAKKTVHVFTLHQANPLLRFHLIGLVVYFGLMKLATYRDSWTVAGASYMLYGTTFAKHSCMSWNRFQSIMSFLHISDVDNEDATDRLAKVQPMLEHLDTCELYCQPLQNVSIDERMVKSKARFPIQQYIKNKPVKWGFKLWYLCDFSHGYTYWLHVYWGKQGEERRDEGLAYDVVTALLQGLEMQGYRVYTSHTLFKHLKSIGFEA